MIRYRSLRFYTFSPFILFHFLLLVGNAVTPLHKWTLCGLISAAAVPPNELSAASYTQSSHLKRESSSPSSSSLSLPFILRSPWPFIPPAAEILEFLHHVSPDVSREFLFNFRKIPLSSTPTILNGTSRPLSQWHADVDAFALQSMSTLLHSPLVKAFASVAISNHYYSTQVQFSRSFEEDDIRRFIPSSSSSHTQTQRNALPDLPKPCPSSSSWFLIYPPSSHSFYAYPAIEGVPSAPPRPLYLCDPSSLRKLLEDLHRWTLEDFLASIPIASPAAGSAYKTSLTPPSVTSEDFSAPLFVRNSHVEHILFPFLLPTSVDVSVKNGLVILYGDFYDPEFPRFSEALHECIQAWERTSTDISTSPLWTVLFRHAYDKLSHHERDVPLSGFGIELAVKNPEYKTVDERDQEDTKELIKKTRKESSTVPEFSKEDEKLLKKFNFSSDVSKPDKILSAKEMETLGVQTISYALNSSTPFHHLEELLLNFPAYASHIVCQKISPAILKGLKMLHQTVTD
ncbi:hypothetical protein IE077_003849, partial [Cardiosporidium cionae]